MPRENLTKKQISEASALELVLRRDYLFALEESTPEGHGISMADVRECVAIDAELRRRLKKLLRHSTALKEMLK